MYSEFLVYSVVSPPRFQDYPVRCRLTQFELDPTAVVVEANVVDNLTLAEAVAYQPPFFVTAKNRGNLDCWSRGLRYSLSHISIRYCVAGYPRALVALLPRTR